MTSIAQLNANRLNSQKSTGPRSEAGKRRSSENALLHGLTAKRILLPGEDSELFETFWSEACAYFAPQGAEILIVRDWFELTWRLRRVSAWETAIFQMEFAQMYSDKYWIEHKGNEDRRMVYVVKQVLEGDVLSKLHRYEARLHRQLVAITRLLLDLRKARGETPLPIATAGTT